MGEIEKVNQDEGRTCDAGGELDEAEVKGGEGTVEERRDVTVTA